MNENDGIIIEDDIAPSESFVKYCEELLDAYREDKRIGMICGTSYHSINGLTGDYTFGRIGHVWGWATWSDRWPTKQDREKYLNEGCNRRLLRKRVGSQMASFLWHAVKLVKSSQLDTWDMPYICLLIQAGKLVCVPRVNLVDNIGFGMEATHTKSGQSPLIPAGEITVPVTHPGEVTYSPETDSSFYRTYLGRYSVFQWLKDREKEVIGAIDLT